MSEDTLQAGNAVAPKQYGRLVPPYPVEHCANADCTKKLAAAGGAYLFRDLESHKLVTFCDDCAAYVELNHRERFLLIAL